MSVLPLILAAALLYVRGLRLRRLRPWRIAAFATALATIVVALEPPLHTAADRHLWAHMTQHVLLMMVAAPLLVLAAPWMQLWRPFHLGLRRSVAKTVLHSRWWAPVRAAARFVALPAVAWILFNADLGVWHVPWMYDLTVRNQAVHDLEHLSFLLLGVLFWVQVIDSPPFHPRLDYPRRVVFLVLGAAASWILAVVLALSHLPLYSAYASTRGGLDPLADQQLAAGVMWGLGSIPFAIGILVFFYRWLAPHMDASPVHT